VQRREFLPTYERYLANSRFTATWVQRLWNVPAEVLYPPVRPEVGPADKRPLVLNVGRFFDPRYGHSKKQLELIGAFDDMALDGWELALAGGCDAANREYALAVRRAAIGRPIQVHVNAAGEVVRRLFAEATIYWHAAGYGEDQERNPERFEHFGITVVEAMAAGAIPLVFGAAGPAEIVEHGVNGYHWRTFDELVDLTRRLAADPFERGRLMAAGHQRARQFSAARFAAELTALLPA
jgi:glycosyltransferase involved in cell wall biosynthesis